MLKGLFQGIGKIFGFKNKEKNNTEVSSKNNKKGVLEKFLAVTKNLKRNNSEKKTEKKESKFVVTDKNGNVLNGNDNKEKGKGQGNKEIDVIQKELNDTKNQISDLKLKMNTKHGTYEIIIPNEMVQNAGNFNINLSDTKSLKEKAKKFGYDLDNKSQFQKALSALGITAKKVSKEKDNENNTEDNENNLKRDRQRQFLKNSFADKNEAFNSQLFANKFPSASVGASLGTGIALGEIANSETGKNVTKTGKNLKEKLEKLVTSAISNKNNKNNKKSTKTLEKVKN